MRDLTLSYSRINSIFYYLFTALRLGEKQFEFLMIASDKRYKDLDEKKKQCNELQGVSLTLLYTVMPCNATPTSDGNLYFIVQ